jgi:hypothetical protein
MINPVDDLHEFLDQIDSLVHISKRIYIFLDLDIIEVYPAKYIFPVAHDSVIREMKKGTEIIFTHDPYFFQFDTLIKGYDVVVLRDDKGVVLSELLNPETSEKYTEKKMRWANNVYKMLMADAFIMQPMIFPVPPPDHASIDVLKRPIRGL